MTHQDSHHSEADRSRWRAFLIVLTAGFMTLLDVSIVNVALPSMESGLHANSSAIQWIVAGYSLAFGLVLVPAGRLGDIVGRRRMFLIGVAGFTLVSAAAGFAPTAEALAVLRLVQGVFAGVMNPQVIALIQDLFGGAARARAFGYFGMIVGVSTAVGPLLGGVLVSSLGPEHGWRSVFLINVPIGLVVIPLAARFLPAPAPSDGVRQRLGLDTVGLVLIGGSVLVFMWPFVTASSNPGGLAGASWWMIAVALAGVALLIVWERWRDGRGKPAVLPGVLIHNRGFVLGASMGAVYFAGFTGIFVVVTLFYQQGLGVPAWVAGLAQTPYALASAVAARRAGLLVVTRGRRIVIEGLVLLAASMAAIALLVFFAPPTVAGWLGPVFLFSAGWGGGSVISPNQALALADVPGPQAGTASGLLQTLQRVGGSVGLALVTTVFYAQVGNGTGGASAYAHALGVSILYALAMVSVAIVIAVIDARRRDVSSV